MSVVLIVFILAAGALLALARGVASQAERARVRVRVERRRHPRR
jgi:hypothetical protein